jgi:hypothetical protein
MRFDVFHHAGNGADASLGRIEALLQQIVVLLNKEASFMATIDEALATISDNVAELPTIDASLDALFAQLATLLAGLKNAQLTPAQQATLDTLVAAVTTHKDKLKADIVANTPAQP